MRSDLQEAKQKEDKKASQKSSFTQELGRFLFPKEKASVGLTKQYSEIEDEINQKEKNYPPPPSLRPASTDDSYNQAGALVGTFVGFGSGHGFQSRYKKRGWWYTVGEVGVLFVPGGVFAFIGAKIVESWDVWNYQYQESLGYPKLKD